jgi:hypothetical protein
MGKMNELDIERKNEEVEPTDVDLDRMLKELNIASEAEFKDKILEDWEKATCPACLKEVKLTKAVFINDAPYHKWCAEAEERYDKNDYEE